jgi:hypothetical protein
MCVGVCIFETSAVFYTHSNYALLFFYIFDIEWKKTHIKGTILRSAVRVTQEGKNHSAIHVCVLGVSSCSE